MWHLGAERECGVEGGEGPQGNVIGQGAPGTLYMTWQVAPMREGHLEGAGDKGAPVELCATHDVVFTN